MGGVNTKEIKWDTKIKKLYAECETNILSGTSVYLGNIREFFIEKQPFIFIRDEIPYSEARMIYGDWDRFEYVPKTVVSIDPATSEYVDYRDFSIVETSENMVEVIKYQDPHNNEFMITLNGVMMLPIKFPLTAVSPSGMYTVAKGDAEVISKFFAYSKSIPAKTKVDQEVLDEITKMVLLKMKKSFMPPVANNTGRVLSRKIFLPGKIVDGVNPNSIQEIGTNTGPTAAEFNTFQLIKQMANEKSIDPVFAGESGGEQTASEAIQRKQQQMMKLGQTVVGIIELERRLVELRIHNILANWTLPVDTKVDKVRKELVNLYRTVQVETTFQDNGKKGTKIINFDPKASEYFGTEEGTEELRDLEDKIKESTGKETRFTFLNADVVRNFDGFWYVDITPTEEQSSQLDRVLFMENLTQAIEIFGMQSMNMEYIKQRFAQLSKEDPDKYFLQGQTQQPASPEQRPQMDPSQIQQQLAPPPTQTPSINTLANS